MMEFKVIEESKTKLVFELKGETHTFCNALKHELHAIKGVETITYKNRPPFDWHSKILLRD